MLKITEAKILEKQGALDARAVDLDRRTHTVATQDRGGQSTSASMMVSKQGRILN
jgi:hypothetical protein